MWFPQVGSRVGLLCRETLRSCLEYARNVASAFAAFRAGRTRGADLIDASRARLCERLDLRARDEAANANEHWRQTSLLPASI